jgi:hypothetical protein
MNQASTEELQELPSDTLVLAHQLILGRDPGDGDLQPYAQLWSRTGDLAMVLQAMRDTAAALSRALPPDTGQASAPAAHAPFLGFAETTRELPVTRPEFVDWAYRILLQRACESWDAREEHYRRVEWQPVSALRRIFQDSDEYREKTGASGSRISIGNLLEQEMLAEGELPLGAWREQLLSSRAVLANAVGAALLEESAIDPGRAAGLVQAVSALRNYPSRIGGMCGQIVEAIFSTPTPAKATTAAGEGRQTRGAGGRPRIVFVGGFRWTGSGALADLLRGQPHPMLDMASAFPVKGKAEPLFVQNMHGFLDMSKAFDTTGEVPAQMLFRFFLHYVLAAAGLPRSWDEQNLHYRFSMYYGAVADCQRFDDYLGAFLGFVRQVKRAAGAADLKDAFRDYFLALGRVFGGDAPDGGCLVLNSAILGKSLECLACFHPDDVAYLAVYRKSVADHYAAVKRRGAVADVDAFLAEQAQWRDSYIAWRERLLAAGYDIVEYAFEDVVTDEAVRREIGARLGIELRASPHFDPGKSAGNIGIGAQLDAATRAELAGRVGEHWSWPWRDR